MTAIATLVAGTVKESNLDIVAVVVLIDHNALPSDTMTGANGAV
jgi:hypothetical protein